MQLAKNENKEPEYIIPEQQPDVPKRSQRSLSRGPRPARASTSDREPTKTPIAPKRSSSKSSLNLKNDRFRRDPDTYSVQSLKLTESSTMQPTKKGSYSSFTEDSQTLPKARSRRYQSLSSGVNTWAPKVPQAPQRTRSRSSVSSKTRNQELEDYAGYAVVDKVKPARPPPPRRRKHSPDFNTFPRNTPSRPVRNYATLGPSRPPRRCKQDQAHSVRTQSLEHIYTEDTHPVNGLDFFPVQDLHGSNKDLQATNVVEKMKGRPLPAPPRPPRLKSKSEENNSVEVVEEVCVSTQTDPLPDDLCLEDDVIQEFSHEQMKLQQEFLREMREEEERIHKEMEAKRAKYIERDQAHRRDPEDEPRQGGSEDESKKQQMTVHEDDLGYASLDRRQTVADDDEINEPCTSRSFQETLSSEPQPIAPIVPQQPVYVPLIPNVLTTETLRVGNLEVDQLRVNHLEVNTLAVAELNARQISVQELRGANLAVRFLNQDPEIE